MGSLSTMFSAEVMAILRCTEFLLTKKLMMKGIYICSDSRAVLTRFVKTTTTSTLVWECMQVLEILREFNKANLVWMPGEQGIPDKEQSDRLAKEGAIAVPLNQFTTQPLTEMSTRNPSWG